MSVADDIARLTPRPPADPRLDPARAPRAIREQTGLTRRAAGTVQGDLVTAQSTDGLFAFAVRVIKG